MSCLPVSRRFSSITASLETPHYDGLLRRVANLGTEDEAMKSAEMFMLAGDAVSAWDQKIGNSSFVVGERWGNKGK
jgi:pyrroloquinoline quinone (PQQ) biosynthesis protein C